MLGWPSRLAAAYTELRAARADGCRRRVEEAEVAVWALLGMQPRLIMRGRVF